MVATHSPLTTNTIDRIMYTYDTVMHGFAIQLTDDEARRMSTTFGVTSLYKDRMFHLQTTRSPGFIGLNPHYGAWNETDFRDGVIIGIIDSGIWPESASFNDHGLRPVRSNWRGKCVDADDFHATLCNNKLVGAKVFSSSPDAMSATKPNHVLSPRDKAGHGTHVASIASGTEVPDVGMYTFSQGTARGMAPKARIAMHKACDADGCWGADITAAVETAVKDGVDIISMSLGFPSIDPFYTDVVAVSTFGAERKGIFIAMGGGNYGPLPGAINVAPWMITVGATTVDRVFPANLTLGNGVVLEGQSLYITKTNSASMFQLVYSYCLTESANWTREKVEGKIMVCMDDGSSPDLYGFHLQKVSLLVSTGERLRAYMASESNPVASFSFSSKTIIQDNQAPLVAGFSSRGPNPIVPELLKPDIIAPGVNILAGWSRDAPLDDGRRVDYNIVSGTSMATPHVAGIASLIKKKYPSWTPAMIRSALMTTAGTLDNKGHDILDNGATNATVSIMVATPLATGAGHIRPNLALDPGLVYDAGARDYIDFMCTLNYTAQQLRLFMSEFVKCTRTLPGVTIVSENPETYSVTYAVPERVKVTVTPMTLEFKKPNEKKSYTVEFRNLAGGNMTAGWDFGHISWENKDHLVRSPVAFQWKN
ncbi:hypothetical protein QOZ80_7AG0574360 [Eleusine coracana subsp. coracana]|nr:hypothetical protein QOZ80_7AG0574360 [Eleusine coracana subsp. coracana]